MECKIRIHACQIQDRLQHTNNPFLYIVLLQTEILLSLTLTIAFTGFIINFLTRPMDRLSLEKHFTCPKKHQLD